MTEKVILCVKCGQGGGTLILLDNNKYKHSVCPLKPLIEPKKKVSLMVASPRIITLDELN